jgi:hypothetical protein
MGLFLHGRVVYLNATQGLGLVLCPSLLISSLYREQEKESIYHFECCIEQFDLNYNVE